MPLDVLQTVEMIELLENFVERLRPDDEEVRKLLDVGYTIENQSIYLEEIRPDWQKPEWIRRHPFAKVTYVKKSETWKIFWMRADLKWHSYKPVPAVKSLQDFLDVVEKDEYHCFFG
jgi:hypothetical protein